MMQLLSDPSAWAALLTLTALEIILGIDNVVFISVLVSRLDEARAKQARQLGLGLALLFRILLLFALTAIMALNTPVLTIMEQGFSYRDMILIGGGLFLIAKATHEIHREIEGFEGDDHTSAVKVSMSAIVAQLIVIDLVFSIDSIITAIGMAEDVRIMIAAVVIAVAVMFAASGPVSAFIARHPTTKMLALAFLVLIGLALVADGFAFHIPRGYVYSAMAFAALVEVFNVIAGGKRQRKAAPAGETVRPKSSENVL